MFFGMLLYLLLVDSLRFSLGLSLITKHTNTPSWKKMVCYDGILIGLDLLLCILIFVYVNYVPYNPSFKELSENFDIDGWIPLENVLKNNVECYFPKSHKDYDTEYKVLDKYFIKRKFRVEEMEDKYLTKMNSCHSIFIIFYYHPERIKLRNTDHDGIVKVNEADLENLLVIIVYKRKKPRVHGKDGINHIFLKLK